MEFVILIILNIFLGTVFYLVISLKLEKSASEFREKKLRKFMDDIIQEFNATAERNISILENKIVIMKNLLEKIGDVKSIDIEISDSSENSDGIAYEMDQEGIDQIESKNKERIGDDERERESFLSFDSNGRRDTGIDKFTYYMNILKERVTGILRGSGLNLVNYFHNLRGKSIRDHKSVGDKIAGLDKGYSNLSVSPEGVEHDYVGKNFDALIERDYNEIQEKLSVESEDKIYYEMNEEELADLFLASEDKYSLISDLYVRGYTVDIISKCSGVPIGEIRLVLNLNNP
jgi:hypothetical protein